MYDVDILHSCSFAKKICLKRFNVQPNCTYCTGIHDDKRIRFQQYNNSESFHSYCMLFGFFEKMYNIGAMFRSSNDKTFSCTVQYIRKSKCSSFRNVTIFVMKSNNTKMHFIQRYHQNYGQLCQQEASLQSWSCLRQVKYLSNILFI